MLDEFNNPKLILQMDEEQFYHFLEKLYQKIKAEHTELPKNVGEAVALKTLGLKSKTSLWKLRSEGKITYFKMGKIILYEYQSLMDYINEHKQSKF